MNDKTNVDEFHFQISYCETLKKYANDDFNKSYLDLDEKYKRLHWLVENKEFEKINITEIKDLSIEYWKRIIPDMCEFLLNKINNRETSGEDFSDIMRWLNETIDEYKYGSFELSKYKRTYIHEICSIIAEQINHKIEIEKREEEHKIEIERREKEHEIEIEKREEEHEKREKKRHRNGIIYGALIPLVLSGILTLLPLFFDFVKKILGWT